MSIVNPSPLFIPPFLPLNLIVIGVPGVTVIGKFATVMEAAPADPVTSSEVPVRLKKFAIFVPPLETPTENQVRGSNPPDNGLYPVIVNDKYTVVCRGVMILPLKWNVLNCILINGSC